MRYPRLRQIPTSRQIVDTFKGYNHNLRIGDGEFYDMQNMTSDDFPVLSPRGKRGVYARSEKLGGMIAKDSLCYVDGENLVVNGYSYDMNLSTDDGMCPKQLVSMGAYIVIFPDKKYFNTEKPDDRGNLEQTFCTVNGYEVTVVLCRPDGNAYDSISKTQPEDPKNGDIWIDTSAGTGVLRQYTSASSQWVEIATTYLKINATGIGEHFQSGDAVTISGFTDMQELNATHVIYDRGENYIVIAGITDDTVTQNTPICVSRYVPDMDYVTQCNNRLWGCKYGIPYLGRRIRENGDTYEVYDAFGTEPVNEIYACKLGDFRNWNCYMGVSTDSYSASCGTDGQFTGAITHNGYPIFFKENFIHKVYGSYPANFQIQTTACSGVQKGCGKSLAIVGSTLFYKSASGVCAYDGSLPTEVSYALGNEAYSDAVAGALGSKYYISMRDSSGKYHLFVYDTAKNLWHREDDLKAECFCACRGEMYAISGGEILTMLGAGTQDSEPVKWMVQTGEIGISSPDMKYVSGITIRMSMDMGAEVNIYAQYDREDRWVQAANLVGTSLRSFSIPIRPIRCDHMKLRIEGTGKAHIYSVTKTIEGGSEIS